MCESLRKLLRVGQQLLALFVLTILSGCATQSPVEVPVAVVGALVLGLFLAVHTWKDLTGPAAAWYFRSTPLWVVVMTLGTVVYAREMSRLRASGIDVAARFAELPPE